MELSGLSGMEAMERLAVMPNPGLTRGKELEAKIIAEDLSRLVIKALNENKHPFLSSTEPNIPVELRRTFQSLIDEVAQLERQLLRGSYKKRSVVLRVAQLVVGRIRERYGLKDALGELFMLYMRAQFALKRRSAVGILLATLTYATMSEALDVGSSEREEVFEINHRSVNSCTVPADLDKQQSREYHEKYKDDSRTSARLAAKRQGREDGIKWANTLHQCLHNFCDVHAKTKDSDSAFDGTSYDQKYIEFEMVKALKLCLESFRARRGREGPDPYNRDSDSFVSAVLINFTQLSGTDLGEILTNHELDRALLVGSLNELYDYFNEANDFTRVNDAHEWKLEVDNQGFLVPTPLTVGPSAKRSPSKDVKYAKATVLNYRLENFVPEKPSGSGDTHDGASPETAPQDLASVSHQSPRSLKRIHEYGEDKDWCIHQMRLWQVYHRMDVVNEFSLRRRASLQEVVIKNYERYGSPVPYGPCRICGH